MQVVQIPTPRTGCTRQTIWHAVALTPARCGQLQAAPHIPQLSTPRQAMQSTAHARHLLHLVESQSVTAIRDTAGLTVTPEALGDPEGQDVEGQEVVQEGQGDARGVGHVATTDPTSKA